MFVLYHGCVRVCFCGSARLWCLRPIHEGQGRSGHNAHVRDPSRPLAVAIAPVLTVYGIREQCGAFYVGPSPAACRVGAEETKSSVEIKQVAVKSVDSNIALIRASKEVRRCLVHVALATFL